MDNIIPEDVKQFILNHIDSIAEWEGLLLLRANRQTRWDSRGVARNLFINEAEAGKILHRLCLLGFLAGYKEEASPAYHYHLRNPEWEPMIERSAEFYRKCLIPMTNLIHSKSKSRIQEFADAFKLRKD